MPPAKGHSPAASFEKENPVFHYSDSTYIFTNEELTHLSISHTEGGFINGLKEKTQQLKVEFKGHSSSTIGTGYFHCMTRHILFLSKELDCFVTAVLRLAWIRLFLLVSLTLPEQISWFGLFNISKENNSQLLSVNNVNTRHRIQYLFASLVTYHNITNLCKYEVNSTF